MSSSGKPSRPEGAAVERALREVADLLGERFDPSRAARDHHAHGEGWYEPMPPDAVAFPETNEEVAAIARICSVHRLPLVPFGSGTSVEGHVMAVSGGLCVDLTRMNRVLEVNENDLDCRVQTGVTKDQLNRHLKRTGLFFPVDPGADCSLGGMAATGASGTTTVRYGAMRENVLGLTVVLADGRTIRTGSRARKSSAGFDLTRLFLGSEGTLGIITELGLRLYGIPEAISAAVCAYPDLESAVDTVIAAVQLGLPVARCELLDGLMMGACIRHSGLTGYEEKPTLFFEFHGGPEDVRRQAEQMAEISDDRGGGAFRWATKTEERNALWKARHDAYFAGLALAPGKRGLTTDTCVPISELAGCIREAQREIAGSGLVAPIVGHVGDGNFHLIVLCDPDNEDEVRRGQELNERLVDRALEVGGTCTGEHGIGRGKRKFLEREHGEGVDVMRSIKRALDPAGILNPGKVFSDEASS